MTMKAIYRFRPTGWTAQVVTIPCHKEIDSKEVRFIADEGFDIRWEEHRDQITDFSKSTVQIIGAGMYLPPSKMWGFGYGCPEIRMGQTATIIVRAGQIVTAIS